MLVSGYNVNVIAAINALTCNNLTNTGCALGRLMSAGKAKTQFVIVTACERPAQSGVLAVVGQ